jgi:hypothetical protein
MRHQSRPDFRRAPSCPLACGALILSLCGAGCLREERDEGEGGSRERAAQVVPGGPAAAAFPPGRGATVPWIEHQAEDGITNATVIGPSRIKWDANHIEAEAIGRRAVRLSQTGHFVAFRTTAPANSIVVRFSIPDAPGGGGIDRTLGLYVNGTRVRSLQLTSRYAWSYRGGTIGDPNVDLPAEQPHTFFDEAHTLLDPIPVGAEVKLQRDVQDTAAFYVIDLVDFEQVAPPLAMPAGFRSITEFGVQPNDGRDHAAEIQTALRSTTKLWFPPGEYLAQTISNGNVGLDNPGVEVRGAGMWHTTLRGAKTMFFCIGASTSCIYRDLAIFGESKARAEETQGPQKAFAGPLGNGSLIENVWIEHKVAAIWVGNDPPHQAAPTQNLTIRNCRIRNTYADGVNFDNGTSNSLVEHTHFRNTGDDAVALWSIKWTDWVREMTFRFGEGIIPPDARNAPDQGVGHGNVFRHLTVQMPWRANCYAAYGGNDNVFEDSICEDVLTYPGILIDHEFSPYPFGPALTVFRNISLARAGGQMFLENTGNPWRHGALKLYLREGDVNDILVENVEIIDPTYSGIEFRGFGTAFAPPGERVSPQYLAAADNARYTNVTLRNVTIANAGTNGIEIVDGATRGAVTFDTVSVSGSQGAALAQGGAPDSFFNRVGNNTGWSVGGGGGDDDGGDGADDGGDDGGDGGDDGGDGGDDGGDGGGGTGNLALHRPVAESSHVDVYVGANATDGNQSTYWESANNAFPQSLTVDLGTAASVSRVVLKLPTASWGARTQTLSVLGSTNGSTFTTLAGSRGISFDPASANTATISFSPVSARFVRVVFTANTGWPAGQLSELEVFSDGGGGGGGGGNLALSRPVAENSHADIYVARNAVDGNQSTYWESASNAFPQNLTVDLGAATPVGRVVLKLPVANWGARTQTVSVRTSTDGASYTTIVGSSAVAFNPASANTATIPFAPVSARFVRLVFTANTGWPAAQVSEFEVFAP